MKKKISVLIILGMVQVSNLIFAQPGEKIVVHKNINSVQGSLDVDLDGDQDIIFEGGWIENENGNYTVLRDWSLVVNEYGNELKLIDVDSDGDYDLWSQYEGGWFENLGDLVFSEFDEFVVNAEYSTIQYIRDFNADGYNDLLLEFDCGCADPDQWSVALNDGNLSFTVVNSVNSLQNANLQALEDFNGDGILDIFTSISDEYTIMLCDADANLVAQSFDSNTSPFWYLFGDFNGDGLTDYFNRQEFQVYLNQGNLEFQPGGLIPDLTGIIVPNYPRTFITDWDLDGDLDIALGDDLSTVILANNGSSSFEIQSTLNLSVLECLINTGIDEFDDIVVSSGGVIVVYENNGIELSVSSQLSSNYSNAIDLATADLDGDGDRDIITQSNSGIVWLENSGSNVFSFGSVLAMCPDCDFVGTYYGYGSFNVLAEDYDLDGDYDVVYSSLEEILLVENLSNGQFANPVAIFDIPENYWSNINSIDIDSDGGMDILYTLQPSYVNQDDGLGVHCLMNDADLSFYSLPVDESFVLTDYDWNFVSFFDYNGDDSKDLIIQSMGNWQSSPTRLLLSDGEGTFTQSEMPVELLRLVSWADIDVDGDMDVVSLNQDDQIIYRLNDGVGNLSDEVVVFPEMSFMDVRTLDMNLDGLPELLATNIISGSPDYEYVIVYIDNLGNLIFDSPSFYSWIADPIWTDIIVENMNSDPYPEVVYPHILDIYLIKNVSDAPIDIEYGIFQDTNENGVWDETEIGLSDIPVEVEEIDATIYSNTEGLATFSVLNSGLYTFNLNYDEALWTPTTPANIQVQLNEGIESNVVHFGLLPVGNIDIVSTAVSSPSGVCGGLGFQDFIVLNDGNTQFSGTMELLIDPLFEFVAAIPSPDLMDGNILTWYFEDLAPTMSQEIRIWMDFPSFEFMGEEYEHILYAEGIDEFSNVITTDTHSYSNTVACAYDPNDKQAEPIGWEEPHFIESGERIQYKIRFQNTGNAPAQSVVVMDQLDLSVFDIFSFQPVAGSAAYYTCLHDDGLIEFMFLDIDLPDSISDPEGSQGYVIFEISTFDGLPGGTEIFNSAEILFDLNPAIVTNETWHTIMDCADFETINSVDPVCQNESFVVDGNHEYLTEFNWYLDDVMVSESPLFEQIFEENGNYFITVDRSNPLCDLSQNLEITVHPTPMANAGSDIFICEGENVIIEASGGTEYVWDQNLGQGAIHEFLASESLLYTVDVTNEFGCQDSDDLFVTVWPLPSTEITLDNGILTGPSGVSWQWYLNNNILDGANEQELTLSADGVYHVITTSEDGCTSISEPVTFSWLDDSQNQVPLFYPNPSKDLVYWTLPSGEWSCLVYNSTGQLVWSRHSVTGSFIMDVSNLSSGVYQMHLDSALQTFNLKMIVE